VGIVYRKTKDTVTVALREGSLIVQDLKDGKGRSVIDQIRIGDRFYTPIQYLESAMQFRAFYEADGLKKRKKKIMFVPGGSV
jgi:hypothetical protein